MKNIFKFNMLFIIIWFNYSFVFGHSERVHQYIAREGYELMKLHIGYDVPEMLAHLGTSETNGYVDWFTRGNDNFESGKIVCGAFREDVSDIVWGYGKEGFPGMSQGLQYALASVTHFWDADLGDDYPNNFASFYTPDIPYSDIPNAFQKITTYYSDNWLLFPDGLLVTDAYGDQVKLYNEAGGSVSFHYDNLVEFYKTGLIQAGLSVAVNTSNGEEKGWIYGSHFNVDENYRARIAFEILGRMAHLLGDMSVPAHVKVDDHRYPDDETYEGQYMHIDANDNPYSNSNVNYWNAQKVWNDFGSIMNPYVSNDNPLHHLMYTLNQFADHFASFHYDGDDYKASNNSELDQYFPSGVAPTSSGTYANPYSPYTKAILHENIRDATFPHAIRATAGLFYWFAKEAGIIPESYNISVNHDCTEFDQLYEGVNTYLVVEGNEVTISAPQTKVVNGKTYSFAGWMDDFSTSNPRTISPSNDATYTALYKYPSHTNLSGTFNRNNQNRMISVEGKLYKVYESNNRIWLEKSSDNGSTWELLNGGKPIDIMSGSRYPSISTFENATNESFVIVYNYLTELRIQVWGVGGKLSDVEVASYNYVSDLSIPVVSYKSNGARILVAWQNSGDIFYQFGTIASSAVQWYYNSPQYISIGNASNCTISENSYSTFHLAWQEGWTNIGYCMLSITGNVFNEITISDQATISTGNGYPTNYYPSITTSSSEYPIVAWVGSPYYGSSSTKIIKRYKGSGGWNSYFSQYGSNASYPQINMGGSTDVVTWTESGDVVKFAKPWGGVISFGASGSYIQLSNSTSINSMYGSVQNNSSSPYTFITTTSVGATYKINSISLNQGRGFVISKDSSQFFFIMGDVALSGEGIWFAELPSELIIKEKSGLNKYLLTEAFQFSDSDELEFSLLLGVSDSIAAKSVFRKNEKIKFSFELIEDGTNKVLGKYEKFVQRKDDILTNESRTFKLDGKGIGNKSVRLKMLFDTDIKGEYTLLDIRDNSTILPKIGESAVSISYAGELEIKDYILSQNYPNPFNPSTVIKYQIPNDGFVRLKVYDITGQEIATLINQEQAKGRYEINFDASNLSSGVYLYRLNSGSFSKSMKMLFLK